MEATTRARQVETTLPIGYEDADGRLHRTAVLRKMTGRDEAIIADKAHRGNAARMMTELLASCVVRLGSIERPTRQVIQGMYSADRYFLLVKLRELTFGSEMAATYSCPTCKESTTTTEDLSALEVIALGDGEVATDVVVELEDGYLDGGSDLYTSLAFRYPCGSDEEKVAPAMRENASQGKNALMARCLKSVGDMERSRMEAMGTAIFNDLTLGDRAIIDKALNNGTSPGVKLRREMTCTSCGRSFTASLDFSNFLAVS
jgi:hypothetical protein